MGESDLGIEIEAIADDLHDQADKLIAGTNFDLAYPDDIHGAIRKDPRLAAHYFPLISGKNDKKVYVFGDYIIQLLTEKPDLARKLQRVFDEVPELIPLYAAYSLDGYSVEDKVADVPLGRTRLSVSTDADVILAHIQKIKDYNAKLAALLKITNEQSQKPYDNEIAAAALFGGVGTVTVRRLGYPGSISRGRDSVQVIVKPTDSKQADFLGYDFRLEDIGLLDSAFNAKDYQNIGYRFRQSPFDEQSVLNALLTSPFGSPELNDQLDGIPSLQKFIEESLR